MKYAPLLLALPLFACTPAAEQTSQIDVASGATQEVLTPLASFPLSEVLACRGETAFVAAHRGQPEGNYAENALPSLEALLEAGVLVAEIDIAGLKDGTHILYHDGIWDEKSTGKGPVASSTWDEAQGYLLKDRDGEFAAAYPPRLEEVLDFAKDRMFLELDFKSSADISAVVQMVDERGMGDQVIYITYNDDQSAEIARLTDKPVLSLSAYDIRAVDDHRAKAHQMGYGPMAFWTGYREPDAALIDYVNSVGGYPLFGTFGSMEDRGPASARDYRSIAETGAALIVSDYPFAAQEAIGLNDDQHKEILECLSGL